MISGTHTPPGALTFFVRAFSHVKYQLNFKYIIIYSREE